MHNDYTQPSLLHNNVCDHVLLNVHMPICGAITII